MSHSDLNLIRHRQQSQFNRRCCFDLFDLDLLIFNYLKRIGCHPVGKVETVRRRGGRRGGNRKEDRWGESKEQEPTNIQKTDEETRRTTKEDL